MLARTRPLIIWQDGRQQNRAKHGRNETLAKWQLARVHAFLYVRSVRK